MGDRAVIERIGAWEAAGLIDADLAARLRAAEEAHPELESDSTTDGAGRGPRLATTTAAFFGSAVTVAEMFGYVGGGFLLGAWYATLGRIADAGSQRDVVWLLGSAATAVVLAVIGLILAGGSPRRQRAAGVMFVVAIVNVGAAGSAAGGLVLPGDFAAPLVLAGVAAVAAAALFRRLHPAVLTQVGLLGAIATLTWALLNWLGQILFPPAFDFATPSLGPDPIIRVLLGLAAWLLTAVTFGLLGLREALSDSPAAGRRAAVSRLAAGLTAVLGTAIAITISAARANGDYGRVLEPAIGDVILVVVAAVLLQRAFRREASSFIYPAGLGVIIALSDLNANYLAVATSTEVGLLVEGAILLAAGLLFDRLRRRVTGSGTTTTPALADERPPSPDRSPTGAST